MQVVECVLIEDCLAPKRNGQSVSKKPFRRGQRVRGTVTNIALTPDHEVLALMTKDGYVIPEPFLNVLGAVEEESRETPMYNDDIQDAVVVEDELPESSTKSVMDIYNSMKASNIVDKNKLRSRHAINFALVGGAIGLVFALVRGKNKWVFATIGAVGGGVLGNYYGNKIKGRINETNES